MFCILIIIIFQGNAAPYDYSLQPLGFRNQRSANIALHYSTQVTELGKLYRVYGHTKLEAGLKTLHLYKQLDSLKYRFAVTSYETVFEAIPKVVINRVGQDLTVLGKTSSVENGDRICKSAGLNLSYLGNIGISLPADTTILLGDTISVAGGKIMCYGNEYTESGANCHRLLSQQARNAGLRFYPSYLDMSKALKEHAGRSVHLTANATTVDITSSIVGHIGCTGDLAKANQTSSLTKNIRKLYNEEIINLFSKRIESLEAELDGTEALLSQMAAEDTTMLQNPKAMGKGDLIENIKQMLPRYTPEEHLYVEQRFPSLLANLQGIGELSYEESWMTALASTSWQSLSTGNLGQIKQTLSSHTAILLTRLKNIRSVITTDSSNMALPLSIMMKQSNPPRTLVSYLIKYFSFNIEEVMLHHAVRLIQQYKVGIFRDISSILGLSLNISTNIIPNRLNRVETFNPNNGSNSHEVNEIPQQDEQILEEPTKENKQENPMDKLANPESGSNDDINMLDTETNLNTIETNKISLADNHESNHNQDPKQTLQNTLHTGNSNGTIVPDTKTANQQATVPTSKTIATVPTSKTTTQTTTKTTAKPTTRTTTTTTKPQHHNSRQIITQLDNPGDALLDQAAANMNKNRGKRNVVSQFFANSFGLVPAEELDKTINFENVLLAKEREAERIINDTRNRVNDINFSVANMSDILSHLAFQESTVMEEIKQILGAQTNDESRIININAAMQSIMKINSQIMTLVEEIGTIQSLIKDLRTTASMALRGEVDLSLFDMNTIIQEIGSFMTDHLVTDHIQCVFSEGDYKLTYHVGLTEHPMIIYSIKTIPFRTDGSSFAQIYPKPLVAMSQLFEYSFLGPIETDCRKSGRDYYCEAQLYPKYKLNKPDCSTTIIKNWIFSTENNDYTDCLHDIRTNVMTYEQVYLVRDNMLSITSKNKDTGVWTCPPSTEEDINNIVQGYQMMPIRKPGCSLETSHTYIRMEVTDVTIKGTEDISALDIGKALETIDMHLDLQYKGKFEIENITKLLTNMSSDLKITNKDIHELATDQEIIRRLKNLEVFNPLEVNFRDTPTQSTLIILGWLVIILAILACICAIPKLCCQVPCNLCIKICCSCRTRRNRDITSTPTIPSRRRHRNKGEEENIDLTELSKPLIGKFQASEFTLERLQNDRNWMITGGKLYFMSTEGEGLEYNLISRGLIFNGETLIKDVLAPSSILARFLIKPILNTDQN